MTDIDLAEENARLKARLAETEAALADAVLAQKRLESIVSELRREAFGRKSEKLDPEPFNLPLEDIPACRPKVGSVMPALRSCAPADRDIEVARGMRSREKEPARAAQAFRKGPIATAATFRNIGRGSSRSSNPRRRSVPRYWVLVAAARWPGLVSRIWEDVSERLDVVPAKVRVLVTRRPK